MLKKLLLTACVAAVTSLSANAGMIAGNFDLTTSGLPMVGVDATEFMATISLTDLSTGVSFDAELTIKGSDDLDQGTDGFGVLPVGGLDGELNPSESLTFSVALSNITGGTAVFDGFTSLSVRHANGDNILFTETGASTPFLSTTVTGNAPETLIALTPPLVEGFSVTTDTIAGGFRASMIGLQFTTLDSPPPPVIPEPSSIALFAIAGIAMVRRRNR